MNEINYEDLAAPADITEARIAYNHIYADLEHLCEFEWFYEFIWKRGKR